MDGSCIYQVAQKNVPLDKMQFVDNRQIFYQKFRTCSGRSYQQSMKILPKYFHCFKNYSFDNISFHISKLHQRNRHSGNVE